MTNNSSSKTVGTASVVVVVVVVVVAGAGVVLDVDGNVAEDDADLVGAVESAA